MQATFTLAPTQRNASTVNIPVLPANSDVQKSAPAGSGTGTATLISAMALGQSGPTPAVPELETQQNERGAPVRCAQEQSTKLSAVQAQLGVQGTELAELESLRKEVARLQELSEDGAEKISSLLRAQKAMAEGVRVRDEQIEALNKEVARLRARVQDSEVRAEGADALRRDLAALEALRGVAAEFASSRALVQQLRVETTTLIRQRDTAISELSKAWEDNDK
ncbi:hypothetical protein PENSPDRAFT_173908 [Peniophora sp. CONT]|nr:hypothetical protein PENSPDRAFT_173908 [Peniophora sp. CONT]